MDDTNKVVMEIGGEDGQHLLGSQANPEEETETQFADDEMETDDDRVGGLKSEVVVGYEAEKGEGSNGNVVFSREAPLVSKDPRMPGGGCTCGSAKKLKSRLVTSTDSDFVEDEKIGQERKLSRQDRIELGRLFQGAVSSHDWELAESLISLADPQTLNDALCISLDSIWFLGTHQELYGITGLIKKIISDGAYDFTRAALRTSFLASCVSACQSRTMSLADTVTVMAQR